MGVGWLTSVIAPPLILNSLGEKTIQEEPDELLPPACSTWPSIGGAQGCRLSDPCLPGAFFLLNRECFTTEIGTVSPEDLSMSVFHLKL